MVWKHEYDWILASFWRNPNNLSHCDLVKPLVTLIRLHICYENDLWPEWTKPLTEPMLTNHHWDCVEYTWEHVFYGYSTFWLRVKLKSLFGLLTHCTPVWTLVNTSSCTGLFPDGIKPLPEPTLTYDHSPKAKALEILTKIITTTWLKITH